MKLNKVMKSVIFLLFSVSTFYFNASAQKLIWKTNITGSGDNIPGFSDVDEQNNIYVIGTFSDSCNLPLKIKTKGGTSDIFVSKLDSIGNIIWNKQIGSSGADLGKGIVVSADGEYIYVTGAFSGLTLYAEDSIITRTGASGNDGFLAKYKKNGDLVWLKNIAWGSGNTTQNPYCLRIDKYGHLVVGGVFATEVKLGSISKDTTLTTLQPLGMFVAQFDTDGKFIKAKKMESSVTASRLYTLDTDTSGYYLSGFYKGNLITDIGTKSSNNGSLDMYVYKVNYNLEGQWIVQIAGTGDEYLYSCSADQKGNVYIGGHYASPTLVVDATATGIPSTQPTHNNGGYDVFFAKYNSAGTLQWFNTTGSAQNDYLYRALYKNGNFIIAGQYGGTLLFGGQIITSKTNADAFAIVHDQHDNLVYLLPINGSTPGAGIGETAAVDSKGNFIVIGDYTSRAVGIVANDSLFNSNTGKKDMFVAKYNKAGVTMSITNVKCNGNGDGSIIPNPKGTLVYPLHYLWTKKNDATFSAATQMITGLTPGTYYLQLTDSLNYELHDSAVVTEPSALTATVTGYTDVKCYNGLSGTINITQTGGTSPYQYTWETTNGSGVIATAQNQSALSVGTYRATVTDNKGCTTPISPVTIGQPDPITSSGTITEDEAGLDNGAVNLTVGGGFGSYTYVWSNSATTQDVSGLHEGNFTVTITDANLCIANASFYVPYKDSLALSYTSTNVLCHGSGTGAIDLTVTGGIGGYTYDWSRNGVAGYAFAQDITGLNAATYSVEVRDHNGSGIPRSISVAITEPFLLINSLVQTNVKCYGESSGGADLSVSGGVVPYNYLWVGPSGYTSISEDLHNIPLGTYLVTITDNNGCINTNSVDITEPAGFTIVPTVTPISCYGGKDDGAISLNVSGGHGPYSYLWSNGLNVPSISLLHEGTYQCTITDQNNCSGVNLDTILLPKPIVGNIEAQQISCFGDSNGSLTVNPSGGNGTYSFLWNNGTTTQINLGLAAGDYSVIVTDIKNCRDTLSAKINPAPTALSVVLLEKQDASCAGTTDGQISVNATGGTGTYTYEWSNNTNAPENKNLVPDDYTVTVTDKNNCFSILDATVENLHAHVFTLPTPTVTNCSCPGTATGEISIVPAGGKEPYSYQLLLDGNAIGNNTGASSGYFKGLNAATGYSIVVQDDKFCGPDTSAMVTVTQPAPITIIGANAQNATTNIPWDGSLTVNASGGSGKPSYILNNTVQSVGTFTGLAPGNYKVIVIDGNNCTSDTSDLLVISYPTGISGIAGSFIKIYPNPAHDYLTIEFSELFKDDMLIEIMSMSGQIISSVNLKKDMIPNRRFMIDLSSQARGMYLVIINHQVVKEKILLQ